MLTPSLLTAGLIVSQLSSTGPAKPRNWFSDQVLCRVQVIGFFVILEVFDDSLGAASVEARFDYFVSLFGI